jgi:hypothetical protein
VRRTARVLARLASGVVGLVAVTMALATPAHADGIHSQGEAWGDTYHFGRMENGWVSTEVGVEFYYNDDFDFIKARGYAVIDKELQVRGVRVDRVRLGILTAPGGVLTDSKVPALDHGSSQASKETAWVPVTENIKTCGGLKLAARAYFTVRWADGRLGSFSVLSKTTTTPVCRK